jgi:serine/threonine protein kinase
MVENRIAVRFSTQLRPRASLDLLTDSPVPPVASLPAVPAERLGSYEVLLELASGGMATVSLARATDRRQGPPLVAIKRPHRHLSTDKTFLSMIVDEARLASAIQHPNVVRVRELGFEGGVPFIVMDYVEGASLAELRRELCSLGRALDIRVAVRIVLDALAGLHAAHQLKDDNGRSLNIVHRDISPHNILIGCDGRSHLTDFGIAKAEDRIQTTRTHEVKGKLAYLAPERVDKRRLCTAQSDVFSMAVVLWECFAGRRLFRGEEPVDVLQEVISGDIPTLAQIGAQVPSSLDDVIARALSRDLDSRYATASELAQAIERAVEPKDLGASADVARLVEAVFGARMAQRQEHVRSAIGSAQLADLLRESGLSSRDSAVSANFQQLALPAELAPPAPAERYLNGRRVGTPLRWRRALRVTWWSVAGAGAGVLVGAIVTLALVARHSGSSSSATPADSAGLPSLSTRRVLLALPFRSSHVEIDGLSREMDPPTDVVSIEVPADAGIVHRIVAAATDGSRAEGTVQEEDGVARPEPSDLIVALPMRQKVDDAHRAVRGAHEVRPVGTVKNGFTKLR